MPHQRVAHAAGRHTVFSVPTKTKGVHRVTAIENLTEIQAKTLRIVEEAPGITIRRVANQLRVTHSTTSYHLLAVARMGLIEQLRDGREMRNFPLPRGSSRASYVHALLRDQRAGDVVRFICRNDVSKMTLNQIATQSGFPFGFVRRTLLKLEDMNMVALVRRSYRYHLRVTDEFRKLTRGEVVDG